LVQNNKTGENIPKTTKTGKNIPKTTKNCQIISKLPNGLQIYQIVTCKYANWPKNIPNGQKINQQFPFEGPPNLPKFGFLFSKYTI
jgi:hypothetical protein